MVADGLRAQPFGSNLQPSARDERGMQVGLAIEGTGVLVLTETPELAALGDGQKANSIEIAGCY